MQLPGRFGGPALQDGMLITPVTVRRSGDAPVRATVYTDEEWLAVDPSRLDPDAQEQTISVQVDPADVPPRARTAIVTIQDDEGPSTHLTFRIRRGSPYVAAAGIAVLVGIALGAGIWFVAL